MCSLIKTSSFVYYLRCLLLRMALCKLMVISAFWRATSSRNLDVLPAACTSLPYIWTTSKSFLKHGLRGGIRKISILYLLHAIIIINFAGIG